MDLEHTVFEYLFRDVGNNKYWGQLLLRGTVLVQDIELLKSCMEDGALFIAEWVDIPLLAGDYWVAGRDGDDDGHYFHEFVDIRPATVEEIMDLRLHGTVGSLLRKFDKARQRWETANELSEEAG